MLSRRSSGPAAGVAAGIHRRAGPPLDAPDARHGPLIGPWSRRCSAGRGWRSTPTARPRERDPADRFGQAFLGLFGISGPVTFVDQSDRDRAVSRAGGAGRRGAAVRGPGGAAAGGRPAPPRRADRGATGCATMLDRVGRIDSLSYFALARRPVGDLLPDRQGRDHLPRGRHRVARRRATRSATRRPGPARSRPGWPRPAPSAGCRRCWPPASGAPRRSTGPAWTPSSSATRRSCTSPTSPCRAAACAGCGRRSPAASGPGSL